MATVKETDVAKKSTFRDLIAWQKGMELTRQTYKATRKMPASEQFALTALIRQTAASIPSVIAEGNTLSNRDFIDALHAARGMLAKLSTLYELATSMSLISRDEEIEQLMEDEEKILQGLIRSVHRRKD